MKTYKVKRIGELLFTTGSVKGKNGIANFEFLVDTGSTYTILPVEHLASIGFEPLSKEDSVRIIAANGFLIAPKFTAEWFSCLGLLVNSFSVVGHTLPSNLSRFGILGMDFLRLAKAKIDAFNCQVEVMSKSDYTSNTV